VAAIVTGIICWIGSVQLFWKTCWLAVVLYASTASAQEMKSPRVSFAHVDWEEVASALASVEPLRAADNKGDTALPSAIAHLNVATAKLFPSIATSPVPVLLPFDTASFLKDWAAGRTEGVGKYLSGFHTSVFFYPGPSGYDAALSMRPEDVPGLNLTFVNRVDMQISGSALTYDLDVPASSEGKPVPELEADFPGIRRLILESHLRYTFVRFGVPYMVSVLCDDGPLRARRLACRDADKVAIRFLNALRVAGGAPPPQMQTIKPQTVKRPEAKSSTFTYYAPGDLIPGSGMKGQGGREDFTVYSKIRFPMAKAPAYANSQSFMNWGDCDHTGRVSNGGHGKNASYHCRVNSKPLIFDEAKNYAYPWRDNFCEHRYFYVGECPGGLGHQGQDIRPGWCQQRNDGADRCDPYLHDVVAVRDGAVMRAPGDMAMYLVVDKPGEHIRFRYMHMNPKMLDEHGYISGREVHEGDVIGKVGNYFKKPGGTTYHLHFDVQVPTRQGWVFVNPYMTLVAAYERLIGGRGEVVNDKVMAARAVVAGVMPAQAHTSSSLPQSDQHTEQEGSEGDEAPAPAAQDEQIAIAAPETPTAAEAHGEQTAVAAPQNEKAVAPVAVAMAAPAVQRDIAKEEEQRKRAEEKALRQRKEEARQLQKEKEARESRKEREARQERKEREAEKARKEEAREARKDRRDRKKASDEECKTRVVKGHRRRICTDVAETREGTKHAHADRDVDRHVSHKSARERDHERDVRKGHARAKARHGRA
jgi:hypothetical protein